jgi:hypothetical protein
MADPRARSRSPTMEVPPEPAVVRPRCLHDYSRKDTCPTCNPCAGGHGKPKWRCAACFPCEGGHGKLKSACGICNGSVVAHDPTTVPAGSSISVTVTECGCIVTTIHQDVQLPVQPGGPCNHTRYFRGAFRNYANKKSCPVCNDCGHGMLKNNCGECKLRNMQ